MEIFIPYSNTRIQNLLTHTSAQTHTCTQCVCVYVEVSTTHCQSVIIELIIRLDAFPIDPLGQLESVRECKQLEREERGREYWDAGEECRAFLILDDSFSVSGTPTLTSPLSSHWGDVDPFNHRFKLSRKMHIQVNECKDYLMVYRPVSQILSNVAPSLKYL